MTRSLAHTVRPDTPDEPPPSTRRRRRSPASDDEALEALFGRQRTSADALQDPRPLIYAVVQGLLEVLAGVREAEQLARWFSEDAYRSLLLRAGLATRARSARNAEAHRPVYGVRSVRLSSPADGVVEATAVVSAAARTRAVVLRLEGLDRRWRVTTAALL